MNKTETVKFLTMLQTAYPYHFKNWDKDMLGIAIQTWQHAFQDIDAALLFNITQKYIMTEDGFPPTIAYLREECVKAKEPNILISPEEAWEIVNKAITKYGYYQQTEAFATFTESIKRAVKVIGWGQLCRSENIGIERSIFIKTFKNFNAEHKEKALVPKSVLDRILELSQQPKALELKSDEVSEM